MNNKMKWNTSHIIKHYLTCLKRLNSRPDSVSSNNDKDMFEKMFKDMFFISSRMPDTDFIFNYINGIDEKLNNDRKLLSTKTTQLQLDTLDNFINVHECMDIENNYYVNTYKNKNLIYDALKLTKALNNDLYNYLKFCIRHDRIYETNSKNKDLGKTFHTAWGSYIEIKPKQYNALIILIHELMHGFIADTTNGRCLYENKMDLYNEVVSFLSQFYTNKFLLDNKLIKKEEHDQIFYDLYITAIYDNFNSNKALYNLLNSNTQLTKENIKNYINKTNETEDNNSLNIKKLSEAKVINSLTYMYSFLIATSIYYTYPNPKDAILIALDICSNIYENNEKEILTKYKIDTTTGIDSYLNDYNHLVKKRNN